MTRRASLPFWLGLLLALILTVPAWLPWLDPQVDLWNVDDAKNHMIRLYHLDWLLGQGVWYPRVIPDLFMGYGYPLLNYYAPAFYYLALALRGLLRLDIWDAYRAGGVVAALVGASGAYTLTVAVWRRTALGVLAAVLLTYAPYVNGVNLYKRGDIPEMLALALLPWLLCALWQTWTLRGGRGAAWTAAAALVGAAIILNHNLTALMAAGMALAWLAFLAVRRPSRAGALRVTVAGLLAAGSTAFFWMPAMLETREVQLDWLREGNLDYRTWLADPAGKGSGEQARANRQTRTGLIDLHLHYPHQLVSPPKASLAQAAEGGLVAAVLLGAAARRRSRRSRPPRQLSSLPAAAAGCCTSGATGVTGGRGALLPLALMALVCWLLTFTFSAPVWATVPGLPLLQFPWRLWGPLAVCLSAAAAGALAGPLAALERRRPGPLGRRLGWGLAAAVAAGAAFNGLGGREILLKPEVDRVIDAALVRDDERRDGFGMGTTSGREFLPRAVELATYTPGRARGGDVLLKLYPEGSWVGGLFLPLRGDLRFLGWRNEPLRLSVRVVNDGPDTAQLGVRQSLFLGWRAWRDGAPATLAAAPVVPEQHATPGFMVLAVPPGEHTLTLAFGPSPARLAGMAVTWVAVAAGTAAAGWLLVQHLGVPRAGAAAGWLVVAGAVAYLCWRGARPAFGRFAGLAAPEAAPAQGVWAAPDLTPGRGGTLVNVAEAVRRRLVQVNSPSGADLGTDKFVDVRQLTVTDGDDPLRGAAGTTRREWLYAHPPTQVTLDAALPAGRRVAFQAALSLDPAVWDTPLGDGVRFRAIVTPLDRDGRPGQPEVVLDRVVNPRATPAERNWVPVQADLSRWSGTTVRLSLWTDPREELSFDWAGWGDPIVYVPETDR